MRAIGSGATLAAGLLAVALVKCGEARTRFGADALRDLRKLDDAAVEQDSPLNVAACIGGERLREDADVALVRLRADPLQDGEAFLRLAGAKEGAPVVEAEGEIARIRLHARRVGGERFLGSARRFQV